MIVAIARVFRHLAPSGYFTEVAGPLVSLLRASVDIQHIALVNIVAIALQTSRPFVPFATHFLVNHADPPHIWRLKLECLTLIFPHVETQTKNLILSELEYFAQGYDKDLVKEAVRAIGRCAQTEIKNAARCLRVLLRQLEASDSTLVAESLTVIRHIIQQNPEAHSATVVRLAKALDKTASPSARASIVWLVGEFAGINGGNNIAADTLRLLALDFASESEVAKQQIVLLAAKVYAHHLNRTESGMPKPQVEAEDGSMDTNDSDDESDQHPIALLFSYILLLARYDMSYDLRDRARLYKSLLQDAASTQLATLLLLAPKPTPHAPSPSAGREEFTLGSSALLLGKEETLRDYEPLPEWTSISRAPSPSSREPVMKPGSEVTKGALASIGISGKSRSGSPAYGSRSPAYSSSPKFSQQLEPSERNAPAKKTAAPIESLEDFLASDEEDEDEEDEDENEDDESEEETDDGEEDESEEEEEESDNEASDVDDHQESSKLLSTR